MAIPISMKSLCKNTVLLDLMNTNKNKQLIKTVHLSGRAKLKLEKLLEYLEVEWSSGVKNNFISKLDKTIEVIQSNPDIFPKTEVVKGLHKCVITKQTTLYYRTKGSRIEIVTIFDTRQDPTRLMKGL